MAVYRAMRDEATFKDTLTGLYNRHYLGLRVEEEPVLREIGVLRRRHSRRFTVAARDHGDDFAIVLPDTARAGAVTYAERIKSVIESHPFEHGTVTASLGVASLPESITVPEELVGACQSVAAAKRSGGNRVAGR